MKETILTPILCLRGHLIELGYPDFFAQNKYNIRNSSLAAQDLLFSGDYYTLFPYDGGMDFAHNPKYTNLYKKYNLPYGTYSTISTPTNIGLVMDLAHRMKQDINKSIIDKGGNIINPYHLSTSETLHVYHNSPVITAMKAWNKLSRPEIDKILYMLQHTK